MTEVLLIANEEWHSIHEYTYRLLKQIDQTISILSIAEN